MMESVARLIESIENADFLSKNPDRIWSTFEKYGMLLEKWNQSINLISRKGPSWVHHVYDSLQYLRSVPPSGSFLDIGSGAGFPGIPLKIVLPQIHLTLIESQRKRHSFLSIAIRELGLKNSQAFNRRAEDFAKEKYGVFDVVLFRAVADADQCLKLGEPFLKEGGLIIVKKNPNVSSDNHSSIMFLQQEIPVTGLQNTSSKLMVFKKSST